MKILKQITRFFKEIFTDHRKKVREATLITQMLKNAVDSKAAFLLTSIIPGTWDNKARNYASKRLAEILQYLSAVNGLTKVTEEEAKWIGDKDNRGVYFTAIAAEYLHRETGIDYNAAVEQTQFDYKRNKDEIVLAAGV